MKGASRVAFRLADALAGATRRLCEFWTFLSSQAHIAVVSVSVQSLGRPRLRFPCRVQCADWRADFGSAIARNAQGGMGGVFGAIPITQLRRKTVWNWRHWIEMAQPVQQRRRSLCDMKDFCSVSICPHMCPQFKTSICPERLDVPIETFASGLATERYW